jgi:hypothetical protein
MHYCHFEPGRFPDSEFELVRGRLYRHSGAVDPFHTDDGASWVPPRVIGADAVVAGPPIIGPAADAAANIGDHPDDGGDA